MYLLLFLLHSALYKYSNVKTLRTRELPPPLLVEMSEICLIFFLCFLAGNNLQFPSQYIGLLFWREELVRPNSQAKVPGIATIQEGEMVIGYPQG